MLSPHLLLSESQRLLEERLCQAVGGVFPQVDACSVEQLRSLGDTETMLLDQSVTGLHLLKKTETLWPCVYLFFGISRKQGIDCTHDTFSPALLLLGVHLVHLHGLHQPMDTQ